MRSKVMLITPKQAQKWLKNNNHNRPLSPAYVHYLSGEMLSGRFHVTHQGIAFGEDGKLIDGQHRLAAIIEADMEVNMMVTFGMPMGDFAIIDRGMRRNMAVILGIPKFAAECCTFMLRLSQKKITKPSPNDVFQLHKRFGNIALSLQDACNTASRFYSSVPIKTGALVSIAVGGDKDYVLQTYRDLVLQNLPLLPKVALALVRVYDRGALGTLKGEKYRQETARTEAYVRARYLFNKSNADFGKIQIGEKTYDQYLGEVSNLVLLTLRFPPYQKR